MVLLLRSWVKKTVPGVKTHWLSGNEEAPGTVVNKESHADSLQGYEKTHHNWFPSKRYNNKQCFQLPIPYATFIFFKLNDPRLYMYIYIGESE